MEDLEDDGFHFRGEGELETLLEQGVDGTEPNGKIIAEFAVAPNAS